MNAELKSKWVAALRSGEFKQGRERLQRKQDGETLYCCLGVLCHVAGVSLRGSGWGTELSPSQLKRVGLTDSDQTYLTNVNDGGGYRDSHSFDQIADWIEANL